MIIDSKIQLFSTPIWGFILNAELHHSIDYIEFLESLEKEEPSIKKSNFGGWQSRDNLHKENIMQEFVSTLSNIVNSITKLENLPKLHITSMWGNINYKNSFNGNHVHGGSISGVFYLRVPENSGRLIFVNPAVRSHVGIFNNNSQYAVTPQNLVCILFPSWLEHYVEPNLNDEKRISLSFNFDIEGVL